MINIEHIIGKKHPELIEGIDTGIEIYSVTREIPHFQIDTVEILMCLKGKVEVTISHIMHNLNTGDFVVINANEVHHCSSDGNSILVSFYFNKQNEEFREIGLQDIYLDNIQENTNQSLICAKEKVQLYLLKVLFLYVNKLIPRELEKTFNMLKDILDLLIQYFQLFYVNCEKTPHSEESQKRFNRIMSYLIANYNRRITMNEISSNENISSNYLSIYIKKTTLMGITDILSFIRTHESEKILLSKDIGIIDVAYECGFSDQKLYYKTFKNLYGCTPNQHRKKMRELVYASETNNVIDIEGEKSMLEHAMLTVISIYN